jgi:hypothetical protein
VSHTSTETPDPIDDLRRADPVDPDLLPPGSEARLRARMMERTMEPASSPQRNRARVSLPVLTGLAVAALALAIVVGTGLLSGSGGATGSSPAPSVVAVAPSPTPAVTGGPVGGGSVSLGQCAFEFNEQTLAARGWAFDATVTAIAGNQATFLVQRWFKGGPGESVTRTIDGLTDDDSLLGGPGLDVGGRYLVTGDDDFAWSCGFTQFWNADVANDWARIFGA